MPLYCGDKAVLPNGYEGFDTRYNCLRKGVGVGKGIATAAAFRNKRTPWYIYLIVFLVILLIVTILLVFVFM